MAKQSIFGRIATLTRANINALLDNAEDPEKMLDQMVRDYRNSIAEAQTAIAQTIGNLRMMERDYQEDQLSAKNWGSKALAASQRGDQMRSQGNTAEADKFDNLAKIALQRQIQAEGEMRAIEPTLQAQQEVVARLKTGLEGMKSKMSELQSKRNQLVARSKVAAAQNQMHDAVKGIDMMDPTSELSRFEEKVRREEAKALGQQELAASSLDAQFNELEDLGEKVELENRLAALKSGGPQALENSAPKAISSADHDDYAADFAALEDDGVELSVDYGSAEKNQR